MSPACPALHGSDLPQGRTLCQAKSLLSDARLQHNRPMRHLALILALVPGPALAELPGWWRESAVWAGDGIQDNGPEWSLEITLEKAGALISYPSIPCSGRLDILDSNSASITFRETITEGTLVCITGGTVVLRGEAGGSLLFDWSDPVSGLKATAILAPPVS